MKRWFIPAAARARGQSNDLNREILASNLFNCHKEVINAPPVPSISRYIHIVYRHKNVWEYQWSNFIYNCMSTFLHYVRCKDALLDCSAPGGERCESLTWVDEIHNTPLAFVPLPGQWHCQEYSAGGDIHTGKQHNVRWSGTVSFYCLTSLVFQYPNSWLSEECVCCFQCLMYELCHHVNQYRFFGIQQIYRFPGAVYLIVPRYKFSAKFIVPLQWRHN